jgi:hypothetical protein
MRNFSRIPSISSRRSQRGAFMLEISLALMVLAAATYGTIREQARGQQISAAYLQADALKAFRDAADAYVQENYTALQFQQNVTVNGVTLANGAGVGQSRRPRVQDLVAMGYLRQGFEDRAILTATGGYSTLITLAPSGCVGPACSVTGLAFLSQPVVIPGTSNENYIATGAIMSRLGGISGTTDPSNTAQVVGVAGTYTAANPVSGSPRGVVVAAFGDQWGGERPFVRIQDARDPDLQGALTVAGNIRSVTGAVGAGNGASGCSRAELQAGGAVVSRTNDCVDRSTMDADPTVGGRIRLRNASNQETIRAEGRNGFLALRDGSSDTITLNGQARTVSVGSGGSRVLVDGTTGRIGASGLDPNARPTGWGGGVHAWDVVARGSAGVWDGSQIRAAMSNTGTIVANDTAGASTVVLDGASGRAQARTLVPTSTASMNTTCTELGAIVQRSDAAGALLTCQNTGSGLRWVPATLRVAAANASCSIGGENAVSAAGQSLICRGGRWTATNDLLGRFILMGTVGAVEGTGVTKPTCPLGAPAQQIIILVPYTDVPSLESGVVQGVSRYADDNGSSWTVRIRNSSGTVNSSSTIAHLYCYYASI